MNSNYLDKYLKYYLKFHRLRGGSGYLDDFLNNYPLENFGCRDIINLLHTTKTIYQQLTPNTKNKIARVILLNLKQQISQLNTLKKILIKIRKKYQWYEEDDLQRGQQAEDAYYSLEIIDSYLNKTDRYLNKAQKLLLSKPDGNIDNTSLFEGCRIVESIKKFSQDPNQIETRIENKKDRILYGYSQSPT